MELHSKILLGYKSGNQQGDQMNIDGDTLVFGVVGDPVRQVRTPGYLNPLLHQRGRNIICVPLHIAESDFSVFWAGIRAQKNLTGLGITVPHKETAMRHCNSLGASARRLGVVNAVRRQPDGTLHGDNFDGQSFVAGLVSQGYDPSGHDIFVYGAGGAAKAICFALADARAASISIQNRTKRKAVELAQALQQNADFANAHAVIDFASSATMVINASSLGMNATDPLPVDPARLRPDQIVAEVVALPRITKLLHEAGNLGCPTHSGLHMITNQMELIADFVEGN